MAKKDFPWLDGLYDPITSNGGITPTTVKPAPGERFNPEHAADEVARGGGFTPSANK